MGTGAFLLSNKSYDFLGNYSFVFAITTLRLIDLL